MHDAVYVQNQVPHQALINKTPEEIFTGNKLDTSHLRIFGCPLLFHVLKDKRNKQEAKEEKVCLWVKNENSKAYKIYTPSQRKVEICRDITFDGNVALSKERDLHLPPKEDDDDKNILDGTSMPNSNDIDTPMEPMDPLDPPPSHPPIRKIHFWLRDTLQDSEKSIPNF